jgi:hypothetical protein
MRTMAATIPVTGRSATCCLPTFSLANSRDKGYGIAMAHSMPPIDTEPQGVRCDAEAQADDRVRVCAANVVAAASDAESNRSAPVPFAYAFTPNRRSHRARRRCVRRRC